MFEFFNFLLFFILQIYNDELNKSNIYPASRSGIVGRFGSNLGGMGNAPGAQTLGYAYNLREPKTFPLTPGTSYGAIGRP